MTIRLDNETLTAYLLGELDAAKRETVEAALENDAEARHELEQLKTVAAMAREAFQEDARESLTDGQRTSVLAQVPDSPVPVESKARPPLRRYFQLTPLLAAACVLLAVGVGLATLNTTREEGTFEVASGLESKKDSGDLNGREPKKAEDSRTSNQLLSTFSAVPGTEAALREREQESLDALGYVDDTEKVRGRLGRDTSEIARELRVESILQTGQMSYESTVSVEGAEVGAGDAPSYLRGGGLRGLAGLAGLSAHSGSDAEQSASLLKISEDVLFSPASRAGQGVRVRSDGQSGGGGLGDGSAAATSIVQRVPLGITAATPATRQFGLTANGDLNRPFEAMARPDVKKWEMQMADIPEALRRNIRRPSTPPMNTEAYDRITDNRFLSVADSPLSTFSIDVDTASYANVRRFLNQNTLPPKDAVRIEELINYFDYDYAPPEGPEPFSSSITVVGCPWTPEHRLVRIGLKGRTIPDEERPPTNLVFLLDVSGSMRPQNKLPLLRQGMKMLTRQLGENDRIAIVVYAGSSGLVLPSTSGDNQAVILDAIDRLQSGGSTNGGAGIELAYNTAIQNFIEGGVNRVILATDGDFNVGMTNQGDLIRMIENKAKSNVFLTVLGFGMGNVKDSTLEKLADKGNGNYAYIDNLQEAQKVLVTEMGANLITIAKDVKIQVEFNPAQVDSYRLIGYENRILAARDFNDDTKDAGEIGAGHTVTVLYEVVPAGLGRPGGGVDPLKYQQNAPVIRRDDSGELLTVKLRYKDPTGNTSKLLEFPVRDSGASFESAPADLKFAAAVASYGMVLRDSPYRGNATFASILQLAGEGMNRDKYGYRTEFVALVRKARQIMGPVETIVYWCPMRGGDMCPIHDYHGPGRCDTCGMNLKPKKWYLENASHILVPQETLTFTGVKVLRIVEVRDGVYRAQIKTNSSTKWYNEEDEFEIYELRDIDATTGCVELHDQSTGQTMTICM